MPGAGVGVRCAAHAPALGMRGPRADSGGTVSCPAEPRARSPVLPHRLPPAVCPLRWPPVPTLAGASRRPSQGALPRATQQKRAKDSVSWERTSALGLQLLLLGGWKEPLLSLNTPLRPEASVQRGTAPATLEAPWSCFLLLFVCPRNLRKRVLGKWGSSWGPGPLDCHCFWLGVG